jgi:hypothetical protein
MAMVALSRVMPMVLLVQLCAGASLADGLSSDELQRAQVERLRAELANELHLQAFDLLDELVYAWTQQAPFAIDTAVVIADVTVPLGYGSGLEALIENHLTGLLLKHRETHVRLSHCPACSAVTVHAEAKGTVIGKGIDQPAALAAAGLAASSQHALFLDFEAEGSALVLRARITALTPSLPIVYARTLSTTTSSAALLRAGDHLVSAEEAKQQYLDALQGRGPLTIPVRLQVSQFAAPPEGNGGIAPLPLLWLQGGAEMSINHTRDWTGSLVAGATWIPQLYSGFMVQARINRLLTGPAVSLDWPNLYLYAGGTLTMIQGTGALLLRDDVPTIADIVASLAPGATPSVIYPSIQLGLDLRIGNRIGVGFFVETMPTLNSVPGIGRYLDFGLLQVHSIGGEASLCF